MAKMNAEAKAAYYAKLAPTDPASILKKIQQIVEHGRGFTPFEASLLKETARMANYFKAEFRITEKQTKILDSMWIKYVLPTIIDAKTKERP